MNTEIFTNSPLLIVASQEDVCIAIPRGEATIDVVRTIQAGMTACARERPKGFALLFIVEAGSSAPNGAARAAASEMFRSVASNLKAVAGLLEGSGFGAAVKRSVFTWATGQLLGKTTLKTFAELDEATTWLVARCGEARISSASSDELRAFVRELRSTSK